MALSQAWWPRYPLACSCNIALLPVHVAFSLVSVFTGLSSYKHTGPIGLGTQPTTV